MTTELISQLPLDNQTPVLSDIEMTAGPSLPLPAEGISDYEAALAQIAAIYALRGSYPDPVEAARLHLLEVQTRRP